MTRGSGQHMMQTGAVVRALVRAGLSWNTAARQGSPVCWKVGKLLHFHCTRSSLLCSDGIGRVHRSQRGAERRADGERQTARAWGEELEATANNDRRPRSRAAVDPTRYSAGRPL